MADDSEKPTDEPTNSGSDSVVPVKAALPRVDEWKEAGATTLGLIQRTFVAYWARLRPLLEKLVCQIKAVFTKRASDEKPVSSEPVPRADESKKPIAEPFPTVNQWTETGKTIFDLSKRSADTFFNKPTSNQNAKNLSSRQAVDVGEDKASESETEPEFSPVTAEVFIPNDEVRTPNISEVAKAVYKTIANPTEVVPNCQICGGEMRKTTTHSKGELNAFGGSLMVVGGALLTLTCVGAIIGIPIMILGTLQAGHQEKVWACKKCGAAIKRV